MAWSGLYNDIGGAEHSLLVNKPKQFRDIARAFRRRSSTVIREVIDTVTNGSSINGAAAVTYPRIDGDPQAGGTPGGGGVRSITSVEKIAASSTTTAAQATQVDGLVDYDTQPSTYPDDLSGNGGGGALDKTYPVA